MDSPTEEQVEKVEAPCNPVEVVVEMEAEAGASGYSVMGGGERGIFVKDVLKDSPAAKHLSLQQGDQLLSAKVYFDNVKYEDALKILQCAEPYKVSFLVKRTISSGNVPMSPRIPSMKVKGPKDKMAKMSVKNIKPFKAKKKRGGRFGLIRLKEKKGGQGLEIEETPPRLEMRNVYKEFSLPTFKQRNDKVSVEDPVKASNSGDKKRSIRCPGLKTKGYATTATGGKSEKGIRQDQVDIPSDVPRANVKTKEKGPKFGITISKNKSIKSDPPLSAVELKSPDMQLPPVEFSLLCKKADENGQASDVKGAGVKIKASKLSGVTGKADTKLRMPTQKIPNVRLSSHPDEIDGYFQIKVEGPEKPGMKSPQTDITAPTEDVDFSLTTLKRAVEGDNKAPKAEIKSACRSDLNTEIKMPNIDISDEVEVKGGLKLSKADLTLPEEKAGCTCETSKVDILLPKAKLEGDRPGCQLEIEEQDIDISGEIQMPSIDVSLPKVKTKDDVQIDRPSAKGCNIKMPSLNISLPKIASGGGVYTVGPDIKSWKFEVPSLDVSVPKMKLREEVNVKGTEAKFDLPTTDISISKEYTEKDIDIQRHESKGSMFQLPSIDTFLPKMKTKEIDIEGPEVKDVTIELPTISLLKAKVEGDINLDGNGNNGDKTMKPSFDISLPKMKSKDWEVNFQGPEVEGSAKFNIPSLETSLPAMATTDGDIEDPVMKEGKQEIHLMDHSVFEGKVQRDINTGEGKVVVPSVGVFPPKFRLPQVDLSMPSVDFLPKGKLGDKMKTEKLKIPLFNAKMKVPEGDISLEVPPLNVSTQQGNVEGGAKLEREFHIPLIGISIPKIKSKEGNINICVPEVNGGKMPLTEISPTQTKLKGKVSVEDEGKKGKFSMPTVDIFTHKIKFPEREMKIQGPVVKGVKFESTKIDLSLPKEKPVGDIVIEVHSGKDGTFEMPVKVKVNTEGKEEKQKIPKCDVSLSKLKFPEGGVKIESTEEGKPEMPTNDICLPKGKTEGEFGFEGGKGGKFHMPSLNISLPKQKIEGDVSLDDHGERGTFHLPKVYVSLPNLNLPGCNVTMGSTDLKGNRQIEGDVNKQSHDMKGVHMMPNIDIPVPKVNIVGDINIEDFDMKAHGIKRGSFQIPSMDITLPKLKTKRSDFDVEGTEVQGGILNILSLDISLPKVKIPEDDVCIQGPDEKEGTFKKLYDSLPKLNLPEGNEKMEGSDKKGHFELLDCDISLPKVKHEGRKGGKLNMPSIYITLPKIYNRRSECEGAEIKGGKIEMSTIDTSKGNVEGEVDINTEVPGHKVGKLDISQPILNLPERGVKIELPQMKGNIEITTDSSLPKGNTGGGLEAEGIIGKGEKFHMPLLDISLPKSKVKGVDVDIDGPTIKRGINKTPTFDISFLKGSKKVEGPEGKGGTFKIPKPDEGEVDFIKTGKNGGGLHMPALDISLPKFDFSLPSGDTNQGFKLETSGSNVSKSLEMSGGHIKMSSVPNIGTKGKIDIDSKLSLNADNIKQPKVNVRGIDVKVKTVEGEPPPTVKLPIVDVQVPKADLDFGLSKPKGDDVEVKLLKAEGGRPSSGGTFEMPDVSLKMPRFSLPNFGGKLKTSDLELEGQIPLNAEGEIRAPSVEFDDVKMQKTEIKMALFGISNKDTDTAMSTNCPEVDVKFKKGKVDIPSSEISVEGHHDQIKSNLKFHKFNISQPEGQMQEREVDATLEREIKGKAGFHVPDVTIKLPRFSKPKFRSNEGNISRPSGDLDANVKVPSLGLSLPSPMTSETKVILPKAEMDISNADMRSYKENPDPKNDLDVYLPKVIHGKCEESEVKEEGTEDGKLKMHNVENSQLKGMIDCPEVNIGGEREKCKTPLIDISLPKVETKGINSSEIQTPDVEKSISNREMGKIHKQELEIKRKGGKFKNTITSVDISLAEGKITGPEIGEEEAGRGKIEMPNVYISFPKERFGGPDKDSKVEGSTFILPHLTFPSIDISQPKGKTGKDKVPPETEGVERGMKVPDVNISLPKEKLKGPEMDMKGRKSNAPEIPKSKLEIYLPKASVSNIGSTEVGIEGEQLKMSNVEISLPAGKYAAFDAPDVDIDVKGAGSELKIPDIKIHSVGISFPIGKPEKIEAPDIGLQQVDISLPEGKSAVNIDGGKCVQKANLDIYLFKGDVDLDTREMQIVTEKDAKIKMPHLEMAHVDFSFPTVTIEDPVFDIREGGGKIKTPQIKMPKKDISLPHGKSEAGNVDMNVKGGKLNVQAPKVDMSLSKGKPRDVKSCLPIESKPEVISSDLNFDVTHGKTSLNVEGHHNVLKLKMPTINIDGPKGDVELHFGLHRGKGKKEKKNIELPDLDLNTSVTKSKVKGPKGKGMPKMKNSRKANAEMKEPGTEKRQKSTFCEGKFELPETEVSSQPFTTIFLPDVEISGPSISGHHKLPNLTVPTVSLKNNEGSELNQAATISSPEENNFYGPKIQYGCPKKPKVKKAVFVLVDPSETNNMVAITSVSKGEATADIETGDISSSMDIAVAASAEIGGEDKSKDGRIKIPNILISPYKSGSLNDKDESSPEGGDEDCKGLKVKSGKMSFAGISNKQMTRKDVEMFVRGEVVSSQARTEMLGRDSSSDTLFPSFSKDLSSVDAQSWGMAEKELKEMQANERESSPWFKEPKFTLKPHSTGFLQITPEGPSYARQRGEVGGDGDVLEIVNLHSSGMDFTKEEEHHVSFAQEDTHTIVTKTTRTTRHVITESRSAEASIHYN